jgi:hypothetical protein
MLVLLDAGDSFASESSAALSVIYLVRVVLVSILNLEAQ